MNLVFAGTPPFAAAALAALADAGHTIVAALTQPQRPAGRGMKVQPSAVAQEAAKRGIPVLEPASLKDPETQQQLRALGADVFVVAAYGLLLPQAVLDIPPKGCLNIHGSLLPRWRGAAPVQRAIEAGDAETGICIMKMEAGLDTGPVLLEKRLPIAPDDTSAALFEKLTPLGAASIVEALARFDQLTSAPQPAEGVMYAKKILKDEARIDWTSPAAVIERKLRAFDPFPGCESTIDGMKLKIWRASPATNAPSGAPGFVFASGIDGVSVHAGEGALTLLVVQQPGGKRMPIGEFLRGHPITVGSRFQ
ncbi:MAG: methionyl-tRNA formyltransferase [Betaproteobacteria bacterium]|nr:methionyl-tRNA formyltransferase [Betaproteobacteria bacterium]